MKISILLVALTAAFCTLAAVGFLAGYIR